MGIESIIDSALNSEILSKLCKTVNPLYIIYKEVLRQIAQITYLDLNFERGYEDNKEHGRIIDLTIIFVNTFQIPGIIGQLTELRKLYIKGHQVIFQFKVRLSSEFIKHQFFINIFITK